MGPYEEVRHALLHDHLKGVPKQGKKIGSTVAKLEKDLSADAAGVSKESTKKLMPILAETKKAAHQLENAQDIETARTAFYTLTKSLVRYRGLTTGAKPKIAYCSMAKRSWLQPGKDIGNPYYGQSMASCGEIVEDVVSQTQKMKMKHSEGEHHTHE